MTNEERKRKENEKNWREDVSADFLRTRGYLIVDNHSHPIKSRPRALLDLVVWHEKTDTMVAVAVDGREALYDQYFDKYKYRLVSKKSKDNYSGIMKQWCKLNGWKGKWRIATTRIYGTLESGKRPVIQYIEY